MKKGERTQYGLFWQALLNFFFKLFYVLVNFFILIGEATRKIIALPFLFCIRIYQIAYLHFIDIYEHIRKFRIRVPGVTLPKPKLTIPKITFPKIPIPKISFPKVSLPKIEIPKIKLPVIKLSFPKRAILPKSEKINVRFKIFQYLSLRFKYFLLGSIVTLCLVFGYQSYLFVKALPSPENIGKVNYALSTHIFDRNGKLLYEIYKDQNRTPTHIADIPNYVKEATIAIEDKDFYKHNGIAVIGGILRAAKETFLKGDLQGGSTITQQLVKTALLSPERTLQRKIKEIILALWAEKLFTKDEILEMYFNQVPYGGSAYGIEEAAKTYFGKSVKDLTLSEAALLAGLPQAPSIYS